MPISQEKMKEVFEEHLVNLPEINQRALRSFNWAEELVVIGKQNGLPIDLLEELQIETMLVLVGLVSPEDYPNELTARLAISPAQVGIILNEVNNRILVPIHDYIINNGEKKMPSEVKFNPTSEITTQDSLRTHGIEITTENTPVTTPEVHLARTGGVSHIVPGSAPIVFNPTQTTSPLPQTTPKLSNQKLQELLMERTEKVNTTLGNL